MQKAIRNSGSWLPDSVIDITPDGYDAPDFGWSIFQLMIQKVDSRAGARCGDLAAAMAFLTGRIVQRAALRESPAGFRLDVSANGVSFLRHDDVSHKLGALQPGTLASVLMEAALVAGARRFPDFASVKNDAQEIMQRRAAVFLRGVEVSADPKDLAAYVQDDVDGLLIDPFNRQALIRSVINACGHIIGYQRARLCPALGAELTLSVALYGGWFDQRGSLR